MDQKKRGGGELMYEKNPKQMIKEEKVWTIQVERKHKVKI